MRYLKNIICKNVYHLQRHKQKLQIFLKLGMFKNFASIRLPEHIYFLRDFVVQAINKKIILTNFRARSRRESFYNYTFFGTVCQLMLYCNCCTNHITFILLTFFEYFTNDFVKK